ncbi:DNA-binding transcriptional repressor AcrR [Thalassovita gelatinovora]|uniref:DNA-binding transcriptional repressor AcrR n=1 Tax=Thalassovita gelatinovora TaxID=53501 RepID=A0A0P1F9F5_THAGE|nr:TetR/AcrR family transcriptional regulator [Thalassovita gelatinovora]QIZ81229.1 TetR/AcrR family transcriptional regulator [Thalassovita gelatinovora]CUH64667.1 DNA-binding transcriptional repressor AcrR [Thalassovita gelatinovora]SEP94013.1 transcriptional regulator, TetR family [Thalassovita gelatinovora]
MAQKADKPHSDGRVARGEVTRVKVLDAAERCFAATGFDAVSIRQIAAESGVTLGVVGFHGGSKEDLFLTVLARRVDALNKLRREALQALRTTGRYTLDDLVDAYITPYLTIASRGDPQWRAYAQLVARLASDDRYYPAVRELYDPVAREFLDAMIELKPNADRHVLATVLTLTVSSMLSIVASSVRAEALSGKPGPATPLEYRNVLLAFCSGGLARAIE